MKDLMVDIETLGNGEFAAIVQISAVYFNRLTGELGKEFDMRINIEEAAKFGEVDGSTLKFWFQQDPLVIKRVMGGESKFDVTLNMFRDFALDADCIWSHATFDFVILTNALRKRGLKTLRYKTARDLRTLCDLAKLKEEDFPTVGKTHDALDDCKFQIIYTVAALNKIKLEP